MKTIKFKKFKKEKIKNFFKILIIDIIGMIILFNIIKGLHFIANL